MSGQGNPLVFLDIETTGLDPDVHEVWEIALAFDNSGKPLSWVVEHSLKTADPEALRLNGYWGRRRLLSATSADIDPSTRQALTGATIVGANPAFDTAFLRRRWGATPWHYRLLDVEAMAVGVLALDRPQGLAKLADRLRADGYDIPAPDHTAAGDVLTTRAVYRALRTIA